MHFSKLLKFCVRSLTYSMHWICRCSSSRGVWTCSVAVINERFQQCFSCSSWPHQGLIYLIHLITQFTLFIFLKPTSDDR